MNSSYAVVCVVFVVMFVAALGAAVLLAQSGYPWLSFVSLLVAGAAKLKYREPKQKNGTAE